MSSTLDTPSPPDGLRAAAIGLALATIGWNVIEGVVAMGFGAAEASLALFGFGVDSFVEVAAAAIVLWRLRGDLGMGTGIGRSEERTGTLLVGGLLTLLAAGVAFGAVAQLVTGSHPGSSSPACPSC